MMSCKDEIEKKPSDLLAKDKMIRVLVDVHLAEASLNTVKLTREQINAVMQHRYLSIMAKDSITYAQFSRSFNYYLQNPDQMDDLYQSVVDRLTTLESRTKVRGKTLPVVSDSTLRRATRDSGAMRVIR